MGLFENLKRTKEAIAAGYRGEGPSEEALAALSPEQRVAYDAQMAQVAETQTQLAEDHTQIEADHAARIAARPLHGPAGEWVYGDTALAGLTPEQIDSMDPADLVAWHAQQSKEQFKDVLRNPFGRKRPPPPAANAPTGPVDRDRQAAAERAARDEARVPYLARDRSPVQFVRLATRGKTQIEEVTGYLASSGLATRPDLVYGVSRVPDRISPGAMGSERGRVVEWDVVHAATDPLPPAAAAPASVFLAGDESWVARAVGEPSVLDEDLALAYLSSAGIGPEQCLGVARHLTIKAYGGGENQGSCTISQVTGVHVLHPTGAGTGRLDQWRDVRPVALPFGNPAGVHVEVLNWQAVSRAVHPARHKAVPIPSPFPYLPSTPQELIGAYLEVVGVHPMDCYSAQVTEDEIRDIESRGQWAGGISYSTNIGEKQPCADGEDRRRLSGGSVVVIAYRDRPGYEEGRERWRSYEHHVLQATLANGTGARRAVEEPDLAFLPRGLRELVDAVGKTYDVLEGYGREEWEKVPPHRYCWPPRPQRV